MSISVTQQRFEDIHQLPMSAPLDEAVWQAWARKGRVREEKGNAARIKAVTWISLAGLLLAAGAGLWSHLTPFDAEVRFLVAAGALVLMFQAFHKGNHALGVVLAVLAVLYNPVAPLFSFSGEWQRAFLMVSALPFVASLTWRNAKLVPNE